MSRKQQGHEAVLVTGTGMFITGLVLGCMSVSKLMQYSPYENPGAGKEGLWLGVAAIALAGAPVLVAAIVIVSSLLRSYAAWKRTLTPRERMAVNAAEVIALTGAAVAWHEHNREVSDRLTASVMGEPHAGDQEF